ncbi:MAG TPA: hypothetical protein VFW00_11520 [Rhodocyclaceae bacterium]|nr:hypothetical protein [Rhodocyclaceae bacterium]
MNEIVFENFLAGKDKLSALLRATPAFEPPEAMANAFAILAREAQLQDKSATPPLIFEPPAKLEQTFLRQASAIQIAQAPRRDALLQQLADGRTPEAVLGADVTTATRAWLDRQRSATPKRKKSTTWWVLLPRIGMAASAALIAGIATYIWQQHAPQNVQTAAVDSASLKYQMSAPAAAPSSVQPLARARKKSTYDKREPAVAAFSAEQKPSLKFAAKDLASNAEVANTSNARQAKPAEAGAPIAVDSPITPAPTAAAAPPPAPAISSADKAHGALTPPLIYNATLDDDATQMADQLASNVQGRQIWIAAASPDSANVKAWAEKMRMALTSVQGAQDIHLEADAQLPSGVLRIELR